MTAVVDTHRATAENGPSVVNGELVWTSATGITTADPNSYAGCNRKWYYDQVENRKGPPTKAMLGGTSLHKEIEDHLRTGASLTSPLALAGRVFIPHPGSGLFIEKPIHFQTAGGIGIHGHVDLYNLRGQYIDPQGDLQQDPSWSFEVKDWKTTSDFSYAKTERDLAENIQLNTYAEAGFRMWADAEHARLTHVNFLTRGRPQSKLVTIRRSREEIRRRWEYAESVVRVMADVAREPTADSVAENTKSCSAYSGCPHREYCSAFRRNSLDSVYGKIANDHLQEKQTMGIIAQTQPQLMQQAAPAQGAPMQHQLAQEEATMRAQVAQQQQQMPQQQFNPGEFLTVCQRLGSYGFGMPSLAGNAAQAYAGAGGQSVAPGFVYQGLMAQPGAPYSLHNITLTEVQQIYQLERECAAKVGPAPAPQYAPAQMPANTPPVTQTIANVYNQAIAQQPVQMQNAVPSFLPPGAPESRPELAQARPVDATPAETPAPAKKPGRPKKSDSGTAPEQTAATAPAPSSPSAVASQVTPAAAPTSQPGSRAAAPTSAPAPAPTAPTGLDSAAVRCAILVNARFSNVATKSLAGYVDYVNAELSKRYSVTADGKPGIQDVRCAPRDSVLAFGGWKGAVREVVKADPPSEGSYHLDTFMDELNEAVADALRVVAESKGWTYVRGVR